MHARTHVVTYVRTREAHMHRVGFRWHAAPTCTTFEIDIWPDFVKFGPHAVETHSTSTTSTCTHVVRVCVCATRSSTRPGFEQQMCTWGSLLTAVKKGAPIFWQVPLSSSARRHLLTFNGPHEAWRNVTPNWVNDHEIPLRETPNAKETFCVINPSATKNNFSLT